MTDLKIKRISRHYIILFICLLLSVNAFTQKNFVPGYIIDLNGNTEEGLINYKNWGSNPDSIFFIKNNIGDEIIIKPKSVKGFCVENELYVSASVTIDVSSNQTDKLTFKTYPINRKINAFLLTLVKGEKSLYYYNSKNKKEYFFITIGDEFSTLIFKRYYKIGDDYFKQRMIVEVERYKGQLMFYLQDRPSLKKKISKSEYTRNSLVNLFKEYYKHIK